MAYEQKDNSGSIFKNNKKKSDNSPPLTGKAMIGGVMYWVSAWTKTDKNDEKWISFSVTPMNPSVEQTQRKNILDTTIMVDDDIPFD